jgi:hypothetical protein
LAMTRFWSWGGGGRGWALAGALAGLLLGARPSAISLLCTPVHTVPVHTVHTGMHTVHTVHTAKGPPSLTSDMLLVSFCCIV